MRVGVSEGRRLMVWLRGMYLVVESREVRCIIVVLAC